MNLVEKLLKADTKTAGELETKIYRSRKLAKILGEEKPVEVEIREVRQRRVTDIMSYQLDKNGQLNYAKTFDAKLMLCTEGITDPDLRSRELQAHFGCESARELCEKLFGAEVNEISDEISAMSGVGGREDEEEEIKN